MVLFNYKSPNTLCFPYVSLLKLFVTSFDIVIDHGRGYNKILKERNTLG